MEVNAHRVASQHALPLVEEVRALEGSPQAAVVVLGSIERYVRGSELPQDWSVTSDSIAAWFAAQYSASELVLLKSCDVCGRTAQALARAGVVDGHFPKIAQDVVLRWVNLRRRPARNLVGPICRMGQFELGLREDAAFRSAQRTTQVIRR
jgi:hypothetical protein